MAEESTREDAVNAMRRINQAWLGGRVLDLAPLVHADMVIVFPGFTGRGQGRETVLAGFQDFCRNATVHEFREYDHVADVAGDTAVVTFQYDMIYLRSGNRYRSTGRDLWVFQKQGGAWIAVWRTMLDVKEDPA